MEVVNEDIEHDTIAMSLLDSFEKLEGGERGSVVYSNGKATVSSYPTGALLFEGKAGNQPIELTSYDAVDRAKEFVQIHRGIPSDAFVDKILPQYSFDESTGKEMLTGYLVVLRHSFNNTKIEGLAGDSIKVLIDSNGVSYYFRLWRNIESTGELHQKAIIKPEKAEEVAKLHMSNRFKTSKKLNVDTVSLVYWSQPFFTHQSAMLPAWKVSIGEKSTYVDALTGEYLEEEKLVIK